MPKSIRRATVTRTVTFTATVDLPGYPEASNADFLTLSGGAAGNAGTLSLGELLAGSIGSAGIISRGNWAVSGTPLNVESYISRPQNTALTVGQRIASVSPPAGSQAAIGKIFVVTTAGTTANTSPEPAWSLTDGGTTTDGTVTFRTIPKFPTLLTFVASTAYTVGQVVRPSANSMREFLVTVAGTSAASAPTWTTADIAGTTLASGTATFTSLVNVRLFGQLTSFGIGDVVEPTAGSTEEYLVTTAGTTDTTATLTASVGASVTLGTATLKRIV